MGGVAVCAGADASLLFVVKAKTEAIAEGCACVEEALPTIRRYI